MFMLFWLCLLGITHTVLTIDCPEDIPNGKFMYGCTFDPGSYCFVTCDPWYETSNMFQRCQEEGRWSDNVTDMCKLKSCKPLKIPNGIPSSECADSVEFGTKCSYSCEEGFFRTSDSILCGDNNVLGWPSTSKLCSNNVQCPEEIANGYLYESCTRNPGVSCEYNCDPGFFVAVSVKVLQCLENQKWDLDVDSLCQENICAADIPNGFLHETCDRSPYSTCFYGCFYNFEATSTFIMCGSDRNWTTNVNTLCREKPTTTTVAAHCGKSITNGYMDYSCQGKLNDRCTFHCNFGYWRSYMGTLRCGESGDWMTETGPIYMTTVCKSNDYDEESEESSSDGMNTVIPVVAFIVILLIIIIIIYYKKRNRGGNDSINEDSPQRYTHRPAPITPFLSNTADDVHQSQHSLSQPTAPVQSFSYISDDQPQPTAPSLSELPAAPPPSYQEATNYPVTDQGLPTYRDAIEHDMEK